MLVKLKVKGMTCGHCAETVRKALAAIPNTQVVEVSVERGEAVVEATAAAEQLVEAVRKAGYEAEAA